MKLNFILIFLVFFGYAVSYGQEVKTEKIRFRINNLQDRDPKTITLQKSSFIEIIDPLIQEGIVYKSSFASLELSGRVTDKNRINNLTINSTKVYIDGTGHFTSKILLLQGENTIRLVMVDENNKLQEQIYTILIGMLPGSLKET